MDFEKAKAFLQTKEGSSSVYDHLTEVILKLITEKPDDRVALLEHISSAVKKASFPGDTTGARAGGGADEGEVKAAESEWAARALSVFTAAEPADGVSPEPTQDLLDEANYLEWAGVGLGREETFRIHLALKHLAAKFPARGVRLWGKILGTEGDYIVAEGQLDDEGEEDATDAYGNAVEKTGEGANKYSYWVCRFAGDEWVQLPNVTPQQVIVARQIRRYFTGRLDATVGGHPPFPGDERSYLRARIACITADTVVSPAGVFVAPEDEDSNDVVLNDEEFDAPDLTSPDGWAHHTLALNVIGRVKPNPPKVDEEGEEIEDPDAPEPSAPLRSAADDEEGTWGIRPCPATGAGEDDTPSFVVAHNLAWPGAHAVGFGKRFANVYVGYGQPAAAKRFEPSIPADLPAEFDPAAEDAEFAEAADVITDPNEGKEAENEDEEDE